MWKIGMRSLYWHYYSIFFCHSAFTPMRQPIYIAHPQQYRFYYTHAPFDSNPPACTFWITYCYTIEASNFRSNKNLLFSTWIDCAHFIIMIFYSVPFPCITISIKRIHFHFPKFSLEENFELFTCLTIKNVLFPMFLLCVILLYCCFISPLLRFGFVHMRRWRLKTLLRCCCCWWWFFISFFFTFSFFFPDSLLDPFYWFEHNSI